MIYIVTPVFNRKEFTRNYLKALSKQTFNEFKIIIVDDGSTDGTPERVEKEFPDVILLREKGNLWWAEATNVGARYAIEQDADYIMTLNDDTVPTKNYIEHMIHWSKKKPDALLGAAAVDIESGLMVYGGEYLSWKDGDKTKKLLDTIPVDKRKGLHRVNFFPGRGLLIPRKVFDEIGFYDSKNFPQTIADNDFTIRADSADYEIYCNYDATIQVYPEESGGVQLIKSKSWKNFYQHLFGMKGAGNLKWFTIFTFKNAPKRYVLQYWLEGVSRRIGGYLIRWVKEVHRGSK